MPPTVNLADPRDPDTAEPLRTILGYTTVEPGVRECKNIYFTALAAVAAGAHPTRPCSTLSNPKIAEWSRAHIRGGPMYLCRDCVPRCLYDGLPTAAFNFATNRAQRGWRVVVKEGEHAGVLGIELWAYDPHARDADVPPPVQAAWQRHVLIDGAWRLDVHEIRGWGVDDSGTFARRLLADNNLFPPADRG